MMIIKKLQQVRRDASWAIWRLRYRTWARFMIKHKLGWLHEQEEKAEEYLKTYTIWPQYKKLTWWD